MRVTQASSNSTVKTSSTSFPSGPSASSSTSPRSPFCSEQQGCESSESSESSESTNTIHHTVMQKKRSVHSSSSSPASNNKIEEMSLIRSDVTAYLENRHSPHFSGGARRDLAPLESAAPKAEMESRVPDDTTHYIPNNKKCSKYKHLIDRIRHVKGTHGQRSESFLQVHPEQQPTQPLSTRRGEGWQVSWW